MTVEVTRGPPRVTNLLDRTGVAVGGRRATASPPSLLPAVSPRGQ